MARSDPVDPTSTEPTRVRGILVEGAAEHNLREVDVRFGDGLTAVVGVSGSGKSSLVFDVVYTEARRRLLAALSLASPWSRVAPARVRQILGLTPAVAVGQDSLIRNPLSTVATASGVHPFLRLIYARFAARECSRCGHPIEVLSEEGQLMRALSVTRDERDATLVIPLVIGAQGSHERLLRALERQFGIESVLVDGARPDGPLDPNLPHRIELVRRFDGAALKAPRPAEDPGHAQGQPLRQPWTAEDPGQPQGQPLRQPWTAEDRGQPQGQPLRQPWTAEDRGQARGQPPRQTWTAEDHGQAQGRPPRQTWTAEDRGQAQGQLLRQEPGGYGGTGLETLRSALREAASLGASHVEIVAGSERHVLLRAPVCPECGHRNPKLEPRDFRFERDLAGEMHGYRLGSRSLPELLALPLQESRIRLHELNLPPAAGRPVREALRRLDALERVGLGYVSLDRPSPTLSRGEAQRLRLAVLLGNQVEDVTHVLDEPTIGLDQVSVAALMNEISTLPGPVLMVEHDAEAVARSDEVMELGPGAGPRGGRVIFQGPPDELVAAGTPSATLVPGFSRFGVDPGSEDPGQAQRQPLRTAPGTGSNTCAIQHSVVADDGGEPEPNRADSRQQPETSSTTAAGQKPEPETLTTAPAGTAGPESAGEEHDAAWRSRTRAAGGSTREERVLAIHGAELHNLDGLDCEIPLGSFVVVTGPSGAGKSTLVRDVLVASLQTGEPVGCEHLEGEDIRAVLVDQSPIGRNPRSNPATYTGIAGKIRDLFADAGHLPASAFSFNRPEGRCDTCLGRGAIELSGRFLPPAWVTCEACGGDRFRPEALSVRISGERVQRSTFKVQRTASGLDDFHPPWPPPEGQCADSVIERRPYDPDGAISPATEPSPSPRSLSIAEVFDLSVEEALDVFESEHGIVRVLRALTSLGLGYLKLGQPSTTLSGGEAQRVKLAGRLASARAADLLVVDEPTTGLHPNELTLLLFALRAAVERGVTVVTVEHHPDVIDAADWVIMLGPGGGPNGGRLTFAGPPDERPRPKLPPPRAKRQRPRSNGIQIRGARAHNLHDVSVSLQKGVFTVLAGVSGSGKSSLLVDVLEAEASRRLLECLSMYERQSVREGPEAPVDVIDGLGPAVFITPERPLGRRATAGSASEISYQIAVLLAYLGDRKCESCGSWQRRAYRAAASIWTCPDCGSRTGEVDPRRFLPSSWEAACPGCRGAGELQRPRIERLIVRPDLPICGGALFSPGFYPEGYLCRPGNGGYDMLQALAARHGFDPRSTRWKDMSATAREAFLNGDAEPMEVEFRTKVRTATRTVQWNGVFPIIEGWDVGGLYTERVICPECRGGRLRPEYLAVSILGWNRQRMHEASLVELASKFDLNLPERPFPAVEHALASVRRRLDFLQRVGLGYLHLDRRVSTLSAGEAQRLKLASLLGGELTGMTVLLDEPSRGLHPGEVGALAAELTALARDGCTVVAVEHDPEIIRRADEVVVLGPGAGAEGGRVVAQGSPREVSEVHPWVVDPPPVRRVPRHPSSWMSIRDARENNLTGEDVSIPLGVLVGLCGVSGSGKSTLAVDTIGRALAPKRITTSVAYETLEPGAHAGIDGAPDRTVMVDQAAQGVTSPAALLGISRALRRAFADSEAGAHLGERGLVADCDSCHGRGLIVEDLGFLPSIHRACDACDGTGYRAEVRAVRVRGHSLPATEAHTVTEVLDTWGDVPAVGRPLKTAVGVGLGHLVLRQPGWSLSGGELQRLKLVKELSRPAGRPTLFILDEPTVGQQAADVAKLVTVLDRLVDAGHTVLVVDHNPWLLSACDWLIELGPGAGPEGGRVVATGPPEILAALDTPTAPYIREALA